MKKKVLKIVIPAVAVVVIGGAMVLNGAVNAGKELEEAMKVEAMTVETGDVTEIVETNGTVVSGEQKVIFSPVNANVEVADFQVGDLVKAGEQLVTFGLKDLEEQNQKAELTVRANELGYQDAVNKSNEAANRQAEARTKAASLQNQVDAKIREVEYLTNVMTGQVNAQVAASQQEAERLNGEIGELQVQLEAAQKEQETAKEAYDQALSAQQTAQVNFEAAAAEIGRAHV